MEYPIEQENSQVAAKTAAAKTEKYIAPATNRAC
jgi:hypothetical protein